MASLPPQPSSQRRSPHRGNDSASASSSSQHELNRPNSTYSSTSVDSQTLLLNSPPPSQSQSTQKDASASQPQAQGETPPQHSASQTQENEPRKCWICFSDETEDDETSSEWRSPCPCVLVAHEKCLLDWIADMEAPSGRRRTGGRGKILCPQCKSEIKLMRPRSLAVDLVRMTERLTNMLLLPGFVLVLGSTAYSTLTLLGKHTIYEIFGTADALQILEPLYQRPPVTQDSMLLRLASRLRSHWRLDLGLPLIPTALVTSRTNLGDSFLPFLPLIFFVGSAQSQDELLKITWPPSAAFTIATLPYVRGLYNTYYDTVWLPRERQWLKEIEPRAGNDDGENDAVEGIQPVQEHVHEIVIEGGIGGGNDEVEDDGALEEVADIDLDFDLFADWNNGGAVDNNNARENPPVPVARGPAPPLDAPALPEHAHGEAAPAPNVPNQPRRRVRRERALQFSTTSIADTVLGALIFPSIAAAVGEALKHALPKSWVTPPANGKPTGFLQAKWARSIVGGCLVVGVKDAVLLYVRWKMAQNHRKRRVLDYDRSKDKKEPTGREAQRVGQDRA